MERQRFTIMDWRALAWRGAGLAALTGLSAGVSAPREGLPFMIAGHLQ